MSATPPSAQNGASRCLVATPKANNFPVMRGPMDLARQLSDAAAPFALARPVLQGVIFVILGNNNMSVISHNITRYCSIGVIYKTAEQTYPTEDRATLRHRSSNRMAIPGIRGNPGRKGVKR